MTASSPAQTSHPDGFGGARDASILASYDRDGLTVNVQAVERTMDLLKRAGFADPVTHEFYQVRVRYCDRIKGFQLA